MLRWRLISAFLIISVLVGFITLDYQSAGLPAGFWMFPLLLVVAFMASGEALALLKSGGMAPVPWAVHGSTLMVIVGSGLPILYELGGSSYPPDCPFGQLGWSTITLGSALIVLFVSEMLRYEKPGQVIMHVGSGLLVVVYVGGLLSFLVALRRFYPADARWGMIALVSMVAVVKISDSGAYFVGRACGRRKLAPLLSPKKTVAGAVGGLVSGSLAAAVYFRWIVPAVFGMKTTAPAPVDWACWMFYGLVLTLAGMVGDLAESLWKRDAELKDSSQWLPGLGGVLDIMDSLLFASVPAYICWALGLIGPG